jgi:hypothetical protein
VFHPAPVHHAHTASLLPLTAVAIGLLLALVVGAVYLARR